MNKRILFPAMLLGLVWLGSSCASSGGAYKMLYTDQDKAIDFAKYKTFAWMPESSKNNTLYDNEIILNNTKNYFTHEFLARNLAIKNDTPDLLLELVVSSVKKQRTQAEPYQAYAASAVPYQALSPRNPYYNPYPNQYNYVPGTVYTNNYYVGSINRTIEFTQSTITLNAIDRQENKLVWKSVVEADLYDPAHLEENLHPAVHEILSSYPIKPAVAKK